MKKIFAIFGTSLIAQVIALIYGLVLPRLILGQYGSEMNGLIQSITQFLGIISFLEMGIGQVIQSALYKPLVEQDYLTISRVMGSANRFYKRIAFALLGYIVVLIFVYPLLVSYSFDWKFIVTLVIIMGLGTFAQYYCGIVYEQLLHADQKSYLIYGVQIGTNLVSLLVCVVMIQLGCSIHALKFATILIFLAKPLVYVLYVRKRYHIDRKITYTEEPIQQKWHGVAQHIASVVLSSTDNVVLTIFSTLHNVSIYSVYYMVVATIQRFYYTATIGVQAAAGRIWVEQDEKKIKHFYEIVEFSMHTITIFLFGCTGVLIIPFVQIYTNGLTDANYVQPLFAYLLVLAYGVFCLRTPYNIWILAAGHFKQTRRCHIVSAAINLLISIVVVANWGLIGVAVGTLVAMCYQTVWMAVYTTRKLVICKPRRVIKRCVADIVMVGAVLGGTCWISLTQVCYWGWFIMAIKVAGMAGVCIVASSAVFYPKECLSLLKRISSKFLPKA